MQFSVRWLSTLGRLIAATTVPMATRPIHSGLPCSRVPSTASFTSCTVGAMITGFSGITATMPSANRPCTASRIASMEVSAARLTTTAIGGAWCPANSLRDTEARAPI